MTMAAVHCLLGAAASKKDSVVSGPGVLDYQSPTTQIVSVLKHASTGDGFRLASLALTVLAALSVCAVASPPCLALAWPKPS
jgi:hypothetical protein